MSRKRSVAWEFFKKASSTVAVCELCSKEIRFHGSTGNLMDHLKRKHREYLTVYSLDGTLESANESIFINEIALGQSTPLLKISPGSKSRTALKTSTDKCIPSSSIVIAKNTNSSNELSCATSSEVDLLHKRRRYIKSETITKQRKLSGNTVKEIENLLVDMFAEGYLPFTLVENHKFIKLLNILEPCYELPSKKYLNNTLVDSRYLQIKDKISSSLAECKYISLTANIWSLNNCEGFLSFLSVTAHFIQDGQIQAALLSTDKIDQFNTAENIASNIRDIITEWNIGTKTFALVTDNGSVMADVARILELQHLGCLAHTINLIVSDVFDYADLDDFSSLRQKCKRIIEFFKNSTIGSSKLTQCQNQLKEKILTLKQETPTRWNSTFVMIERLIEMKSALIMALSYINCGETLTSLDWDILQDSFSLLEPLYELTGEISEEQYSTASIIIPLVGCCLTAIRTVEPTTQTGSVLKSQLLNAISTRTAPYKMKFDICAKATILDPRFKKCGLGTTANATSAINQLITEIENDQIPVEVSIVVEYGVSGIVEPVQVVDTDITSNKKTKKIWKCFLDEKNRVDSLTKSTSGVQEDMRLYLSNSLIDTEKDNINPISYWIKYEESMPGLSRAAFKYLTVPATSVPSEQLFSKAGQVSIDQRNRLKLKNVNKLMFLHVNSKFVS